MQTVIHRALYLFMFVFAATTALVLIGIAALWFGWTEGDDLPYLTYLLVLTVGEVAIVIVAVVKRGFGYLPETKVMKDEEGTLAFMTRFIAPATSATFVTGRGSWLARSPSLLELIRKKAKEGVRFEVITPQAVEDSVRRLIPEQNVRLVVTGEPNPPDARFTLINADRVGAERLAIARGVYPKHEITVFDTHSGPQIIAMAKDIIRKAKAIANASSVGQSS